MNSLPLCIITWMALLSAAWHGFGPSLLTELFLWAGLCIVILEDWNKKNARI